jgi:hypothetical protein
MAAIGSGLILVGVLTSIVGIGGFIDTRKVDRRFRTGYKNNEPDNRNFRRAARRVLYGVGTCIVGAAINNLTESKNDSSLTTPVQSASVPVQTTASDAASVTISVPPRDPSPPANQVISRDNVSSTNQAIVGDAVSATSQTIPGDDDSSTGESHQATPSPYEKIYSDGEITQMEDEKQYHGNDPVVRSRLGLPSRETGKLIP